MEEKDGVENTEIHNYVVLPELTNASFEKIEANVAIKQLIDLIRQKTHESQKVSESCLFKTHSIIQTALST